MKIKDLYNLLKNTKTTDARKFKKLYCGKELNRGTTRIVYEFVPDSRYVVKIENSSFNNIYEWTIYMDSNINEKIRSYFAECLWISKNGKILVQRKVKHKIRSNSYPKEIPHFFNDLKLTNYGWIGKRFVVCDYANFNLIKGMRNINKKAGWWKMPKNKWKMK